MVLVTPRVLKFWIQQVKLLDFIEFEQQWCRCACTSVQAHLHRWCSYWAKESLCYMITLSKLFKPMEFSIKLHVVPPVWSIVFIQGSGYHFQIKNVFLF